MNQPTVKILTDAKGKQMEYREVKMFPMQQVSFNTRGPCKIVIQRLERNVVGIALGDADSEPSVEVPSSRIIIPEGVAI